MSESSESIMISVIIVTYNNRETIDLCLRSIGAQNVPHEIFIVDNASPDGTGQYLHTNPKGFRVIANEQNVGFARANNQVLHMCSGRLVLFLNPDCEVKLGAFKAIFDYFVLHPEIGLAGCSLYDAEGSLQDSTTTRYPNQKYTKGDLGNLPGELASLMGAAIVGNRQFIESLHGFDEEFFLYGEDQDLCLRARKAGRSLALIASACVTHIGGHSEKSNASIEKWRRKLTGEYLFYRKHYHPETIQRIRRAHLLKAGWALFWVQFRPGSAESTAKYQAIWDAAQQNGGSSQPASLQYPCPEGKKD